jgi:hypothetical protein
MKDRLVIAGLLFLGLLQMTADVFGLDHLKALAAVTAASPAPKVFSSVAGLETFSSRFFIEVDQGSARTHVVEITPRRYADVRGPYARRNVYGAALAYGPVLAANPATRGLLASVLRYSLCDDAPLLAELGVERRRHSRVTVLVEPRTGTRPAERLKPVCR